MPSLIRHVSAKLDEKARETLITCLAEHREHINIQPRDFYTIFFNS